MKRSNENNLPEDTDLSLNINTRPNTHSLFQKSTLNIDILSKSSIRPKLVQDISGAIEDGMTRLLLSGPTGSGKTFLSKAILTSLPFQFIEISSLIAFGENERISLFNLSNTMKNDCIFIETIEDFSMITTPRDRRLVFALSFLLSIPKFIIATTRNISLIDPAILKHFHKTFYLKPLSQQERRIFFSEIKQKDEYDESILKQFAGLQPSEILLAKPRKECIKSFFGYSNVSSLLDFLVLKSLSEPEIYFQIGIMPPKGILLSGPSGVGKTTLATMLGQSISMSFFPTKGIDFITKEIGESEQRIHSLFEKARSSAPSLILFDDIDSIAPKRGFTGSFSDRVLTTLLVEMDGMVGKDDGVIVMATTSRLFSLDPAITRPGRFDFIIEIPLPNEDERRNLFTSFCQNIPIENMNEVREFVVRATNGKSGADIEGIIRESAMVALRESIQTKSITISHFEKVIGKGIQSSMNKQLNVFAKPKFRRK